MILFAVCQWLKNALSSSHALSKPNFAKPKAVTPLTPRRPRQVIQRSMSTNEWPPLYTVKRHWRARHVKMTYSHANGLEITVPKRFSQKHIPGIIEENKDWIIKQKIAYDKPEAQVRPTDIHFLAFQMLWSIHYFQTDKRPSIKAFSNEDIILSGDIRDFAVCHDKLRDWVRKQSKILLVPYFTKLSAEIGLPFSDVTIRSQSTLWGSCSQDKSIRLNYKLLFLPEDLMRHIMIHELCHTRHMNHSEKFWQLVATHDTYWLANRKAMKQAEKYMPAWLK